jgi:hypothetical protein
VHAPYLYDSIGEPYKTQKIMRGYQALFRPTPDGMPGNDDLGSMSAWYVWSALGFYPVTGGAPIYSVGSPVFDEATISPVGGEPVTVEAPGASLVGKYIQSATLGTATLERPWFTHDELFEAGNVSFQMGPVANKSWGADPELAPPSMTGSESLSAFGCPQAELPEQQATDLIYTGDTRGRGDSVNLAARLTSAGAPIAGQAVIFEIAGQTFDGVTDADGVARSVATIANHGRSQSVVVRFVGNADYLPSETTATINWGNKKV